MTRRTRFIATLAGLACAAATLPSAAFSQTVANQPVTAERELTSTQSSTTFAPRHQGLFSELLSDFRHLPSKETLTILSIGAAGATLAHQFDARPVGAPPAAINGFASTGNALGSSYVQFGAALATYTLGKTTHSPKVTAIGADLVQAQIMAQALTQGIKLSAGRTRPDGGQYSFPSGHTATAFATATVIQRHLGWKAGIPAYGLASYVAASRVDSKRHYLSDVAFGAAIGIVAGRSVTVGHGNARFAVAPAAAPGGAGVNFTWVGRK